MLFWIASATLAQAELIQCEWFGFAERESGIFGGDLFVFGGDGSVSTTNDGTLFNLRVVIRSNSFDTSNLSGSAIFEDFDSVSLLFGLGFAVTTCLRRRDR